MPSWCAYTYTRKLLWRYLYIFVYMHMLMLKCTIYIYMYMYTCGICVSSFYFYFSFFIPVLPQRADRWAAQWTASVPAVGLAQRLALWPLSSPLLMYYIKGPLAHVEVYFWSLFIYEWIYFSAFFCWFLWYQRLRFRLYFLE